MQVYASKVQTLLGRTAIQLADHAAHMNQRICTRVADVHIRGHAADSGSVFGGAYGTAYAGVVAFVAGAEGDAALDGEILDHAAIGGAEEAGTDSAAGQKRG